MQFGGIKLPSQRTAQPKVKQKTLSSLEPGTVPMCHMNSCYCAAQCSSQHVPQISTMYRDPTKNDSVAQKRLPATLAGWGNVQGHPVREKKYKGYDHLIFPIAVSIISWFLWTLSVFLCHWKYHHRKLQLRDHPELIQRSTCTSICTETHLTWTESADLLG